MLLPPPYCVRKPKTEICSLLALYSSASLLRSSSLEVFARPGCRTSLPSRENVSPVFPPYLDFFDSMNDENATYTTICLRPRSGLRMNLRVRSVTGCSRSAIFTFLAGIVSLRRDRVDAGRRLTMQLILTKVFATSSLRISKSTQCGFRGKRVTLVLEWKISGFSLAITRDSRGCET